jgi:hypothetical protein
MKLSVHPDARMAGAAAAELLAEWLTGRGVRSVMLAARAANSVPPRFCKGTRT